MIEIADSSVTTAYSEVRAYSERLCANLETEDYTPQSVVFASPPKWHLAHTTWFFEEMILKGNVPGYKVFDESFSFLFNSYYNSIGKRIERDQRGLITRPDVETVYRYRRHVDAEMERLLDSEISEEVEQLVVLGLQHEQQHQELLLTDLKYTFSLNPTYPKLVEQPLVNEHDNGTGWLPLEAGVYEVGHSGEGFSFDNELGRHKVYVHEAQISNGLVTNGEFMEFIDAGGYTTPGFWLDEGWAWVVENKHQSPLYWNRIGEEWWHYTLAGMQLIDHEAPLSHISFYEAQAYAAFRACRLPTEFEWEVASQRFDWGQRWEWTNSAYLPYPGFKVAEGAVGEYNGKFMINQMVLRGASVATSPGHSRNTYRNFFHPQMRWQFTGIRLAK